MINHLWSTNKTLGWGSGNGLSQIQGGITCKKGVLGGAISHACNTGTTSDGSEIIVKRHAVMAAMKYEMP